MRRPPLDGVVVLDLSRVLAGPLATMLLADLGARVIKVEDPRGGDVSRGWKPPAQDGEAAYFLSVNRRKESAALDLGTPEGQEFVRRWAAKADVLVENFLPGALEKRGIGVDALRALNPRLVACSISGAGDVGPEAGGPGFDLLAQGATGLMSITGAADGGPQKIGVALVDVLVGWSALAAILAALSARARDGGGAHVKTNLVSTGLAALVNVAGSALVTGREATRHGATPTRRSSRTGCSRPPTGRFSSPSGRTVSSRFSAKGSSGGRTWLRIHRFVTNADAFRAARCSSHPRRNLQGRRPGNVARAMQVRGNPRRSRRRRPRGDSVATGERARIDPR